jgi:hypothetical protein
LLPLLLSLLPLLLSLLPLLLSLLPLLLAAGSLRAVTAERRPGPGSRLLLKVKESRAFQSEGSDVESDECQGYGDFLQKRAEMKKRRAAQK